MSKYFLIALLLIGILESYAQAPLINFVSKDHATVDEVITISGSSFNPNAGQTEVSFAGVKGEILYNSENLIEVKVPAGAPHGYIEVLNRDTGLRGFSPLPFYITYQGDDFSVDRLSNYTSYPGAGKIYDLCGCDFNLDGKIDIAAADNTNNQVSIFTNNSTPGNPAFNRTTVNLSNETISVNCGDLDGDGKPDLVFTKSSDAGSAGNLIFVLRNTSTPGGAITFFYDTPLTFTNARFRKVKILDLDADGKSEVILSNQVNTNSDILVLPNTSSPGSITFGETIRLPLPAGLGVASSGGLEVRDLNKDGFSEIIVSPYLNRDLLIFPNLSSIGSIEFDRAIKIELALNIVNLTAGDLNADGLVDLAVTRLTAPQGREISVFFNNSTASSISFGSERTFRSLSNPWGIETGDLNGDGHLDLLVGSISTQRELTALINDGAAEPGFRQQQIPVNNKSRNLRIFDVDGDGKPDLNFIEVTDLPESPNRLGIILNKNCMVPTIVPEGGATICQGLPFELSATLGRDITYRWELDTDEDGTYETLLKESADPEVDVTLGGLYQVTAITAGGCEEQSPVFSQIVIEGEIPPPPRLLTPDPVCDGDTLFIFTDTLEGNDVRYVWNGPNNFRDTITDPFLTIPDFNPLKAGRYSMEVIKGECQSKDTSTIAESINLPSITIRNQNDRVLCEGEKTDLFITNYPGFDYEWQRNDTLLTDVDGTRIEASRRGDYAAIIKNQVGCSSRSPVYPLDIVPPPSIDVAFADTFCLDQQVTFIDQSSYLDTLEINQVWDFSPIDQITDDSATYIFTELGQNTFNYTLSYETIQNCATEEQFSIFIQPVPEIQISTPEGEIFCPGDSVLLDIPANLQRINWSTGQNRNQIYVKEADDYSFTATNPIGCQVQNEIMIETYPFFDLSVIASPSQIEFLESADLVTSGGGVEFSWSPGEFLSDSTIADPVATPYNTTTFQVIAVDENGCIDSAMATIEVAAGLNVIPQKIYSASLSDHWEIVNIDTYPDCELTIFNRRGTNVYGPKPYEDDFNGLTSGSPLQPGVYYFLLNCPEGTKSGSILLVE